MCEGDECDDDPEKTAPGICGCGINDSNADDDGIYFDEPFDNIDAWSGTWGLEVAGDQGSVASDSPDTTTEASAINTLLQNQPVDLRCATDPVVSFDARLDLQTVRGSCTSGGCNYHYDWALAYASADGGTTFSELHRWQGGPSSPSFLPYQYDLTEFAGGSVLLKFVVKAQSGAQTDGMAIDNVVIKERP